MAQQPDPWNYVRQGQFQKAIDLYSLLPEDRVSTAVLNNRAYAYLCLRRYEEAAHDFAQVMQRDQNVSDGYSGLALCYWCRYQPSEAVEMWRRGLDALYADPARVSIPGALLYAGVRLRNEQLIREARGLLRKASRRKSIVNWPGAIAPYLLGKLTDAEFERSAHAWTDTDEEHVLLERHLCQYNFFRAVAAALNEDAPAFEHYMRACAQSQYGYLEEEYYIAQWEVAEGFPDLK